MLYSQNEIKVKVGDILEVNKTFLSTFYVSLWGKKYDLHPAAKYTDYEY